MGTHVLLPRPPRPPLAVVLLRPRPRTRLLGVARPGAPNRLGLGGVHGIVGLGLGLLCRAGTLIPAGRTVSGGAGGGVGVREPSPAGV